LSGVNARTRAIAARRATAKPMLPPGPEDESWSTVLVEGAVTRGVAVAASTPPDGLADGLGEAVGRTEPVGVGVGVGFSDGTGVGVTTGLGVGVGVGTGVGVGVGTGVGVGVGTGDGVGGDLGVGVGARQASLDRLIVRLQPFEPVGSSPALTITWAVWATYGLPAAMLVEKLEPNVVVARTDVPSIEADTVFVYADWYWVRLMLSTGLPLLQDSDAFGLWAEATPAVTSRRPTIAGPMIALEKRDFAIDSCSWLDESGSPYGDAGPRTLVRCLRRSTAQTPSDRTLNRWALQADTGLGPDRYRTIG
jgi:hypothetical protein